MNTLATVLVVLVGAVLGWLAGYALSRVIEGGRGRRIGPIRGPYGDLWLTSKEWHQSTPEMRQVLRKMINR